MTPDSKISLQRRREIEDWHVLASVEDKILDSGRIRKRLKVFSVNMEAYSA
jgi:hypothetical protein